jgi:hypothetical protein
MNATKLDTGIRLRYLPIPEESMSIPAHIEGVEAECASLQITSRHWPDGLAYKH